MNITEFKYRYSSDKGKALVLYRQDIHLSFFMLAYHCSILQFYDHEYIVYSFLLSSL